MEIPRDMCNSSSMGMEDSAGACGEGSNPFRLLNTPLLSTYSRCSTTTLWEPCLYADAWLMIITAVATTGIANNHCYYNNQCIYNIITLNLKPTTIQGVNDLRGPPKRSVRRLRCHLLLTRGSKKSVAFDFLGSPI